MSAPTASTTGIGSQLGAILDAIPAMVALVDIELRHRHGNEDYLHHFGVTDGALRGSGLTDVCGEPASAVLRGHAERALVGEKVRWEGWLPAGNGADVRFVRGGSACRFARPAAASTAVSSSCAT